MKKITSILFIALSPFLFTNNTHAQSSTPCSLVTYYSNSVDHITDFSTSGATTDISNLATGAGTMGYSDHTDQILVANAGDIVGFSATSSSSTGGIWILIDSNDDGTFANTEAVYYSGGRVASASDSFIVPSTSGTFFMRVIFDYGAYLYYTPTTGCGHNGTSGLMYWGEAEDYKITINLDSNTCYAPTVVTAATSTIGQTSATISWTDSNSATSFDIEYGLTGFTAGNGTTIAGVTNPYNLTGLSASTTYDVYVAANCDLTTSSSQSTVASFTTLCADQSAAYSQDFSSFTVDAIAFNNENCWRATAGSEYWKVVATTDTSSNNTGPAADLSDGNYILYESSAGSEGDSSVLFSPFIDLSSLTTPQLNFDYHMFGATMGSLSVDLVDSAGNEFNIASLTGQQQSTEGDAFLTSTTDLTTISYTGTTVRIKFTATRGSSFTGDIAIDSFEIIETPTCVAPTGLTVTNETATTATYSWTADSTNTDYSYTTTDSTGATVASASGTSTSGAVTVNVTGLSALTTYTVTVTGICGSDTSSSITTSFTTPCVVATTGFSQNFNGLTSMPSCWAVTNGGDSNTWGYSSSYSLGGNTFSGGVAIYYNSSAHDDYLYSPVFTVTDGVTDGFSFNAQSGLSLYPEPLDISVVNTNTGETTLIYDDYEVGVYEYAFHSEFYDLSAFEGQDIKIAFHSTTTDMNYILLDNFVVGSASSMSAGWAGFTSTTYSYAQNWYAGSVPTGDVTLNLNSDSASNSPTIASAVSPSSLTVKTGVSLTISESGSLETTGDFTNNGTVTMNSTATAHSSLIVGGTSTGSITYNRYAAADRWYITSSPVSGQDIDTFISNEDLAVSTNNTSLVGLADYNNDGSQYAADTAITTGWWDYHQAGDDGSFTAGKGKIVRLASDATDNLLGFTGTISGSVSVPMTVATTAFNLIGNPYPAAVQVTSQGGATNDALSANSSGLSEETAWFWNGATNGYDAVNQNPSQAAKITAPGQGFFVSAAGSGDFSFTTAMQTGTAGSFNRQTEFSKIDLSISADSQFSETDIVYFDGATTGWDNGYDSTNWSSAPFQIFTSHVDTSTSQNLAIQSLPLGNFNDMVVPVGVNASAGQIITISIDTTNWPEGVKIYLEDVDNSSYTLLDGQNAEFTTLLDSNESGIGRFYIHTTSNSLGDENLTLTDVSIYASSRDNLRILGINSGQANVQMFDLMGKQVLNTSFNGQSVNDVKLPNLNTGIYLVNLVSDEGTVNKKIIIQ